MFFKVFFHFCTQGQLNFHLTFEYIGFVFSKLKLDYKFLFGLFILMPAMILCAYLSQSFPCW